MTNAWPSWSFCQIIYQKWYKTAYQSLLRHLGIVDELTIMDTVQQLARPCEAVLERLHVDTRYIAAGASGDFNGGIVHRQRAGKLWHDLTDEFGVTWSMPDEHPMFMDITHHPLADATIADIKSYPFPQGGDPGRFVGLRQRVLELKHNTPYAVVSGISGVIYETCWYMRGLEQWFCDMLTDIEFCEALIDQTHKFWMDWFKVFLTEVVPPVRTRATLKASYGQSLSFWGGAIDSQHVLPNATPARIREDVRRHLEIWKPGGGYVFNNVHNIQSDVSGANITVFYDAAYEFGNYGR